jgi:hypothetical protein
MIKKFRSLEKKINFKLKDKKLKGIEKINVNKINSYLKEISPDIKNISNSLNKKDNIDKLYKKAVKYNTVLDSLEEKI